MRVFMTGATGVVGRRAVPLLVRAGHRVTAIGRWAPRHPSAGEGWRATVEAIVATEQTDRTAEVPS